MAGCHFVIRSTKDTEDLGAMEFADDATIVHRRGGDLTSKADEYRTKARKCEERAEQTRDPFIKQQMLDIAQKWQTMAAYEEKYGR
jgi:hypothetical protein